MLSAEVLTNSEEEEYKECPDCKAKIPIHIGYITWCECGYNLKPLKKEQKMSRIDKLYDYLGKKSGKYIFNKMVNSVNKNQSITFVNGLSILFATLIHLVSLSFFVLGIYLLIFQHAHIMLLIFGVFFLGCSWLTRPQFNHLDKNERIVPRPEMPELYVMIDELAEKMGAKIDGIIINEKYNASITKIGWKRKTIVKIGIPLFATLRAEEQCAILAHELGHYVNKDLTYGFYIGTALDTLYHWYTIIHPMPANRRIVYADILEILTIFLMRVISLIPYVFLSLLLHLIWKDKQEGEYMADYRAAEICGSDTMKKALEKMHYDDIFHYSLTKASLGEDAENVIDDFRNRLAVMPERERKRLKLRCKYEDFKLNATHPPTTFRIRFMERQNLPAGFSIDVNRAILVQAELDSHNVKVHENAVENYRYYRLR